MQSADREPYPGPRPFEPEEQDLFFGREREVEDLTSLITAHPALLLYSQSGAGKTSLLRVGILPELRKEFDVLPVARVRGAVPDVEPSRIANIYVFNAILGWAGNDLDANSLAQASIAEFLSRRKTQRDEGSETLPRAAIFDQFEELFSFYAGRWRDRKGFFEQLADALRKGLVARVLFSMREDYIARMEPYAPLLPEELRTNFRLERLRGEAALEAVREPLKGTSRTFAEGVAEKLVQDLLEIRVEDTPGMAGGVQGEFVEPVQLQVVCQSLWRDLPVGVSTIGFNELNAFGDVNRALARFYEKAVQKATQEAAVSEKELRDWFEYHLITPAGTRGTVYRGPEQTGGIANAAIDLLESEHLIRGEWRAGARWYELVHDRFIIPIRESNRTWGSEAQIQIERIRALGLKTRTQSDPEGVLHAANDLIAALTDAHEGVRRTAVEELTRLPQSLLDRQTVNRAVEALRSAEKSDQDLEVRKAASQALTGFGMAVGTATIVLNVFDGTRQPLSTVQNVLVKILDGSQNQVVSSFYPPPTIQCTGLPVHNDFRDQYTVIASADGYEQAGFTPVPLARGAAEIVDLMLLPENGAFDFTEARWDGLQATRPDIYTLLASGASGEAAQKRYEDLMKEQPSILASLLNLLTASAQTSLPSGNLLSYLQELVWDDTMNENSCFAYANHAVLSQFDRAGEFKPEIDLASSHPGASRGYRQVQVGEVILRAVLYESDIRLIGEFSSVRIELQFDYFKDLSSHMLLEVIPNSVSSSGLLPPKRAYAVRWMAARRARHAEFSPPYTIIAAQRQ